MAAWRGDILKPSKEKNRIYNQLINNNLTDKDLHLNYKLLRNKLTHTINKAKQKYYQKQLSTSTGDSKKTWNVINTII